MKVERTKSFLRSLANRPDRELRSVGRAMQEASVAFGQTHTHAGIGIRRLGKDLFECRAGLSLRLLFKRGPGVLTFIFAGNHDEILTYLRG